MVPIPTRPDVCIILLLNVETPETTRLCAVKSVVVVIPKVLIPETFNCFAVKSVVVVTPKVLIPETKRFVIVAKPTIFTSPRTSNLYVDLGRVLPIPTLP